MTELSHPFRITLPSLSKHLDILEESGLVRSTKVGRLRTYQLEGGRIVKPTIDPRLDLVLERQTDVSPAQLWKAWTAPEHVAKWFAPRPWTTTECEMDLRPGGQFRFVMRSPEGQLYPNVRCFLEIVPNQRMVWTDALLPSYR